MEEKISVAIATYNGEAYIKKQLESILLQLPENAEVIISDDGSTDRTVEIIEQFNDPRVTLLINKGKRGVIHNFENALNHITGQYIFFSDQDDIWKPNKLQACLEYFKIYDILVSDCEIIDEEECVVLQSYFSRRNSGKGFIKNLTANTYLGCCLAIKKKVLKLALPFPKDIPMHDIWLGFIGEAFFKPHFVRQQLVSYRTHNNNISPTSIGISPHSILAKASFRWNIVKYLPMLMYRRWKN